MENKTINNIDEEVDVEIDLMELLVALLDNIWIVILTTLAGFVLVYLFTTLFVTPMYDSTTKIYVLNRQDDNSSTINYSELQTSTQLTKDYMELVTTRPVIENVISELALEDVTYEELVEDVSVSTATDGRIISITATADSPLLAKEIADSIRETVATQIVDIMGVEAVNVVEEANLPTVKSKPQTMKNSIIGALVGFVLAAGVIIIQTITNDSIKSSDDVERYLNLSVLGQIPLEEEETKGKRMKRKKVFRLNKLTRRVGN